MTNGPSLESVFGLSILPVGSDGNTCLKMTCCVKLELHWYTQGMPPDVLLITPQYLYVKTSVWMKLKNYKSDLKTAQVSTVGVIVGPRQPDCFMFSWEATTNNSGLRVEFNHSLCLKTDKNYTWMQSKNWRCHYSITIILCYTFTSYVKPKTWLLPV